jgi:hypothetical protein
MPFQQRTNTSWRSTRSQPAVSRRLFRCLGAHLLRSPLNLKFGKFALAALLACSGHTPSVANPGSPLPFSILCRMTSFRCRLVFAHLPCSFFFSGQWVLFRSIKNPATSSVGRVGK